MEGQQLPRYFVRLIIVFLGLFQQCSGCSCQQAHTQDMFCKSEFALRFVVNGSGIMGPGRFQYMYNIYQTVIFRSSPEFEKVLSKGVIHTASFASMCGIKLENQKKYFATGYISDGKLHISSCQWVQKWKEIPKPQRRMIKRGYNKYCGKCKVETCYGCKKKHNLLRNACIWDTKSPAALCYYKYALCKCKGVHSKERRCRWRYGRKKRGKNDFISCYKDAMRSYV